MVGRREVDDPLLLRVNKEWPAEDESFCSGPGRDETGVLSLTFDVSTERPEAEAEQAKSLVEQLVLALDLPGHLLRVYGCTEEGRIEPGLPQ